MPRAKPTLYALAVAALDAAWKAGFAMGSDSDGPDVKPTRKKDEHARAALISEIDRRQRAELEAARIVGGLRSAKETLADGDTPLPGGPRALP